MGRESVRELDRMAVQAAQDELTLNRLIDQNHSFILRCASAVSRRYITESDDEWSYALYAFTEAVNDYEMERGSFLSFAELVIRRRLTDYFRTQTKYSAEIPVNPIVFTGDIRENESPDPISPSVVKHASVTEDRSITYEIEAANHCFSEYGFTFFDLADCSPKASKTKLACAKAVVYILRNSEVLDELRRLHMLPIKVVEINTNIPRKILERHRKYIISATEILSGDYPHLSEYMLFIRRELENI